MIREDEEEERKREEGNQEKKRQKLGPHGITTMTTARTELRSMGYDLPWTPEPCGVPYENGVTDRTMTS
jgi:hypothetical protein